MPLIRYRYTLLAIGLVLLALTLIFGVNPSGGGARLWLPIPVPFFDLPIYFQPSELLKIIMVIFFASYFTEREPQLRFSSVTNLRQTGGRFAAVFANAPFLGPLLLVWGFSMVLLVWQQDLGAASLFFILFLSLLYVATGQRSYLIGGLFLFSLAVVFAYVAFGDVVAPRVNTWLNPWPQASDQAYQVVQSLYAFGAGHLIGQGIGQGFPDYIPVVHSDFAFAAIGEEWGFLGAMAIVVCFAVLAERGIRTALAAISGFPPRHFYSYLATGITVMFAAQSLLIMSGVTKLLPLTGVTLPFVSYGGSSLLISFVLVGFLLYLSACFGFAIMIERQDYSEAAIARRLSNLLLAMLVGSLIVGVALGYWSVVRSEVLAARPDNPRTVEAELRVQRGRIVDRNNVVLAENTGSLDQQSRSYPLKEAGPAVGHYSFRYGVAGIEAAYDTILRGEDISAVENELSSLMHVTPAGRDVRLTLDATLQQAATHLMDGQQGALILLELTESAEQPAAEIRAMVSQPWYDPNDLDTLLENLDDGEDASFFNRVTQGQYQPGLVLLPLLAAAAVDNGTIDPAGVVPDLENSDLPARSCLAGLPESPFTWLEAVRSLCQDAASELGLLMGSADMSSVIRALGLTSVPSLPIPAAEAVELSITDAARTAVGQGTLTLSPLQVALAYGALAGNGELPSLQLVDAVESSTGRWVDVEPESAEGVTGPAFTSATASLIRRALPRTEDIAGITAPVVSAPDGQTNQWYVGMTPSDEPRYVVVVVLEQPQDPQAAEAIGQSILAQALLQP